MLASLLFLCDNEGVDFPFSSEYSGLHRVGAGFTRAASETKRLSDYSIWAGYTPFQAIFYAESYAENAMYKRCISQI